MSQTTTSPAPSPLAMAKFAPRPADAPQRRATHARGTQRPGQATSRLNRRPVDLASINREPRNPATIIFTEHFRDQMLAKGFTTKQVGDALANPYKVTDVTRYPGQVRYCGNGVNGLPGIAVVVEGDTAITCYEDGTVTALRPDQMDDSAALASGRLARLR